MGNDGSSVFSQFDVFLFGLQFLLNTFLVASNSLALFVGHVSPSKWDG